jgi:phenylpyruvate tautomerase PptA (4-oxalocrotonate tautomerase family)
MLVHVAVRAGRGADQCGKVGACVQRAIEATAGADGEGLVRLVTERALDVTMPRQARGDEGEAAIVILIYPRSAYSERKKRILFGRIGEALEKEFRIPRRDTVIGIIETPPRNWTYGHDHAELALAIEGRLP